MFKKLIIINFSILISTASLFFSNTVLATSVDNVMSTYNQGDFANAFKLAKPLAESGDSAAQYLIGVMYVNGEGVTQDYKQAYSWLIKSAEQGRGAAQFNLGMMYKRGNGVTQDNYTASKWFRKAADQNISQAQFHLAYMFETGNGVPQSIEEAIYWYTKAAEQGHLDAQFNLATLYKKNHPLQNFEKSVHFYKLAAAQGDWKAQSNLGVMYAQGLGTPQNNIKAYIWWSLAEELSGEDNYAAENLALLAKNLNSSQILETRKQAQKCRINNYQDCD